MTDKSKDDSKNLLQCSFCGKNQKEVQKLIAGPAVYICDECVRLCNNIIEETKILKETENDELNYLPKPREIKKYLDNYVIGQKSHKKSFICSCLQPLSTFA